MGPRGGSRAGEMVSGSANPQESGAQGGGERLTMVGLVDGIRPGIEVNQVSLTGEVPSELNL